VAREALLVVDLEGVAGVERPAAMLTGTAEYEAARALLTAEVNAAVEGLVAAGFPHVRVSDSHLSGSERANVRAEHLHASATLHYVHDWYAEDLFAGVEAVACLGMHAPAGTAGFAAHTVDLSSRWSIGKRLLSESDLVLGLAAERGTPVVFVSGDDVLEAHLGPAVPFVRTKRAVSNVRAESLPAADVLATLREAARRAPVPAPALPTGPLRLDYHLVACAEAAAAHGATRLGPTSVQVTGTARERYTRAFAAAHAADPLLVQSVWPELGHEWMVEDAEALLSLPWAAPRVDGLDALAERTLDAFLRLTADVSDESRALRPLTLHMLEGLAPRFFQKHRVQKPLDAALESAASVPMGIGHVHDPDVLQARVDAWYLRRLRGLPQEGPAPDTVRQVLHRLNDTDQVLFSWLLGELAARAGIDARLTFPDRPYRGASRLHDLYWLTHLVLLDTDYFARPLSSPDAGQWVACLLAGAAGVIARKEFDVAGELAFCLASAGEVHAAAVDALLALLRDEQRPDGALSDEPGGPPSAHATATALLAFAGVQEARAR
jgi:D-amino peptidase